MLVLRPLAAGWILYPCECSSINYLISCLSQMQTWWRFTWRRPRAYLSTWIRFTTFRSFKPQKILEKNVGKKLIIFHEGKVGGGGLPLCGKFCKDNQLHFSTFLLLGVTISSDLTWSAHAHERSSKEAFDFGEIFKALCGTQKQLLSVYQLRIQATL